MYFASIDGGDRQSTFSSQLSKVFINANGLVVWYPSFRLYVSCNMDFSAFPYDSHECPIIVAPWSSRWRTLQQLVASNQWA
uniref:Neurotransmitter-gated ion-channel ligand-binding domain-containing protein n=1 Tax=Romanomermis culicivorax TaxID=13658 RepID=A0A915KTK9_ROMCU